MPNQDPKLEELRNLIVAQLKTWHKEKPAKRPATRKSAPLPAQHAKQVIHDFLMTYADAKNFLNDSFQVYLNKINDGEKPESLNHLLKKLMFGRTIAYSGKSSLFPFSNPYTVLSSYHRTDEQRYTMKNLYPELNHDSYEYHPFSVSQVTPIKEIEKFKNIPIIELKEFDELDENTKQPPVFMIVKPNSSLGFLVVNKNHVNYDATNSDRFRILLGRLGITASPWLLSINSKTNIDPMRENNKNIQKIYQKNKTKIERDRLLVDLSQLAINKKSPTHLLAASLYRLITGLPEQVQQSDEMENIFFFLNIALKLYKNNYSRFSIYIYSIVHEISLLLYKTSRKETFQVGYEDFCQETRKNATSAFGLSNAIKDEKSKKYTHLEVPANSGTNAYFIAMAIAMQMKTASGLAPTLKVVGEEYFEFKDLYKDCKKVDSDADIYLMSLGTIARDSRDGKGSLATGIDINKLIREEILKGKKAPGKPVTIVIDASSGLYKHLKLDNDLLEHVTNGSISIIVHESHQKFGLLHTDQAQYGRVFGVCGNDTYSKPLMDKIKKNAAADLLSHLDMLIGAYINIHGGHYLEAIKQQHFNVGSIYRNILDKSIFPIDHPHPLGLTDNNSLFVTMAGEPFDLNLEKAGTHKRDSFAHFYPSITAIGSNSRLSPNATDTIDALIDATAIHLFFNYGGAQLINFFTLATDNYLKNADDANQIILFAVMRLITKLDLKSISESALSEMINGLNKIIPILNKTQDNLMFGRDGHKALVGFHRIAIIVSQELKNKALVDQLNGFILNNNIPEITKFATLNKNLLSRGMDTATKPTVTLATVETLVSLGASIEGYNDLSNPYIKYTSPLYKAVEQGDFKKAELLIKLGAKVKGQYSKKTLVMVAAESGENVNLIHLLLDKGGVQLVDEEKDINLMLNNLRYIENKLEAVKLLDRLIAMGADVNYDQNARSPLFNSIYNSLSTADSFSDPLAARLIHHGAKFSSDDITSLFDPLDKIYDHILPQIQQNPELKKLFPDINYQNPSNGNTLFHATLIQIIFWVKQIKSESDEGSSEVENTNNTISLISSILTHWPEKPLTVKWNLKNNEGKSCLDLLEELSNVYKLPKQDKKSILSGRSFFMKAPTKVVDNLASSPHHEPKPLQENPIVTEKKQFLKNIVSTLQQLMGVTTKKASEDNQTNQAPKLL